MVTKQQDLSVFIKVYLLLLISSFNLVYGDNKTNKSFREGGKFSYYDFNTNSSLMTWLDKMDLLNETKGIATMMNNILHFDLTKTKRKPTGRAAARAQSKPKSRVPIMNFLIDGPGEIYGGIGYEITMESTGRRLCMNLAKKSLQQLEWLYNEESLDDNCRFMLLSWSNKGDQTVYPYLAALLPVKDTGFLPIIMGNGHADSMGSLYHLAFNPMRCRLWNGAETLKDCPPKIGSEVSIGRIASPGQPSNEIPDRYYLTLETNILFPYSERTKEATRLGDNNVLHKEYGHLASGVMNYFAGTKFEPFEWSTIDLNIAPDLIFEIIDISYDTNAINMNGRKTVLFAKTETIINPTDANITSVYEDVVKTTSTASWYTGISTAFGAKFELSSEVKGVYEAKAELTIDYNSDEMETWVSTTTRSFEVTDTVIIPPHTSAEVLSIIERWDSTPIPFTARLRGSIFCSTFDTKTKQVVKTKAPRNLIDKTLEDIDPNWRTTLNVDKMMDDEFEIVIDGEYVSDSVIDVKVTTKDLPSPTSRKAEL